MHSLKKIQHLNINFSTTQVLIFAILSLRTPDLFFASKFGDNALWQDLCAMKVVYCFVLHFDGPVTTSCERAHNGEFYSSSFLGGTCCVCAEVNEKRSRTPPVMAHLYFCSLLSKAPSFRTRLQHVQELQTLARTVWSFELKWQFSHCWSCYSI